MQQEILNVLIILSIGMTTVFAILFLIVVAGSLLVRTVNRFAITKKVFVNAAEKIDPRKLAVISSVVHNITGGKGNVSHIEKL